MIKEKAHVNDQISFVLNGKPVEPLKPAEVEEKEEAVQPKEED